MEGRGRQRGGGDKERGTWGEIGYTRGVESERKVVCERDRYGVMEKEGSHEGDIEGEGGRERIRNGEVT